MHKMMKTMGVMMALGMSGVGVYMMMGGKMPKMKMKKLMNSPYTLGNTSSSVKSN